MNVNEIDATKAQALLEQATATFIDVRDPESYTNQRIPGAKWLHDGNVSSFIAGADKARPVVVYCYKGNASKSGAAILTEKGFQEVYSLAGGMTGWGGPTESGVPSAEAPAAFDVSGEAAGKLKEFLGGESEGTRVRITVEGGRFGLALDEPRGGDVTFETAELPFVVEDSLLSALETLSLGWQSEGQQGFALEGGKLPKPPGDAEILADIEQRLSDNRLMIFLKGTAQAPMCGFSARAVEALKSTGKPFGDKNVLEQPRYRFVLSEKSSWPTIPQIFLDGELLGGCDIIMEMHQSGELQKKVDEAFA
jgi:monothiol glutaredoxin